MAKILNTDITWGGRPCVHWKPDYGSPGKANSYYCPIGPTPGVAWLLMTRSELDIARKTEPATLEMNSTTVGGEKTPPQTLSVPLYLIEANRVNMGGLDDPAALFLLQLADVRVLGRLTTGTGTYNIRSFAQDDDHLTGASGFTWASMLSDLWGQLPPVFGSWPGLPAGYTPSGAPDGFNITGGNLWLQIHAILAKLSCSTSYDPIADTFEVIELGATQSHEGPLPDAEYNAETIEGIAAHVPASVEVYFRDHYKSYGQEDDTGIAGNWAVSPPFDTNTEATTVSGAVTGTKYPVWDDLPRVLDENNADDNSAARATRSIERVTQILQDMQSPHSHKRIEGITVIQRPGSENKAMLWRHYGDEGGGSATEVWQYPGKPKGRSAATGGGSGLVLPAAENLSPFDLSRPTFPNYPRLPNIIQVYHSGGSQGQIVSANGDGLHPARVVRWEAGSLEVLEDCWIRFVDNHDNVDGAIKVIDGEFFTGRLSGIETSGGITGPIYLARSGPIGSVVLAKSDADVSIGGSDLFSIWRGAGGSEADTGVNTTAYDWLRTGAKAGDPAYLWSDFTTGVIYFMVPYRQRWAKAQSNWEKNAGDPKVSVKWSTRGGTVAGGAVAFDVFLPVGEFQDPNVETDNVLAVTIDSENNYVSKGYGDRPIGTGEMWLKPVDEIRQGWELMDGSENATPEGSGIDTADAQRFPRSHDGIDAPTNADSGGSDTHAVVGSTDNTDNKHTETADYGTGDGWTINDGGHDHPINITGLDNVPAFFAAHFIERVDNSFTP